MDQYEKRHSFWLFVLTTFQGKVAFLFLCHFNICSIRIMNKSNELTSQKNPFPYSFATDTGSITENVKIITDKSSGYFYTQLSWQTTDYGGGFHSLATIWRSRTSRYLDASPSLGHFCSLRNYSNVLYNTSLQAIKQ